MDEEHYSTRRASKDGFSYSCKDCERATAQKSYERRQKKKQTREYYLEHKEEHLKRAKDRYADKKDEILGQQKEWRQTDKGKKQISKAGKVRRERLKEQTPDGRDYTREQIIERDSIFGTCVCQICGLPIDIDAGDLQIDHIIPVATGGSDTADNVRCTHKHCNISRPKDGRDLEA